MTKTTINKNLEKSAREMQKLVLKSKRKLLEFETLMSLIEIEKGKREIFQNPKDLLDSLK